MKSTLLTCLGSLILVGSISVSVAGDLEESANSFERIADRIEAGLPAGWEIVRSNQPAILIRSSEPLLAERIIFNPNPDDAPQKEPHSIEISFRIVPYLSPLEQARQTSFNAAKELKRERFAKEQLSGIRSAHMGPTPLPPYAFKPESPDEQARVRRYAFLWVETEPERLPTHHAEGLSFVMFRDHYLRIIDPSKAEELEAVISAAEEIVVPYSNDE
ncbi:hypothetical protein [Stratiformator vulcanicus]|uniref:Secreted protein n=1 Tax=Stratiformator vulcanicus TaxID=2527980 RepID=A0A517R6S1_9PLAN|nr:hypothetical protein [Stratiformator vulcanicus]QDT39579.1 hypothetical protein Pan189_39880 [Stratiformator vulcanicus]